MSHILDKSQSGQLDGLKIATKYDFNSASSLICAKNDDFDSFVSVFNVTTGHLLFKIGDENYSGTTHRSELNFNILVSGMSNSDDLHIVYKPVVHNNTESLLERIIDELKNTNKILNKIYQ